MYRYLIGLVIIIIIMIAIDINNADIIHKEMPPKLLGGDLLLEGFYRHHMGHRRLGCRYCPYSTYYY